jgi:alpha-beta hydrolase superfamily lysophospholipase
MHDFDEVTTLSSGTGAEIHLRRMNPKGNARAIVQVNHGLAEHGERYAPFATFLADRNYAIFVHDHRGHGMTKAPDSAIGLFGKGPAGENWKKVVADVHAVNSHARDCFPDVPLITFGHSMGSMVALNFALSHPDRQDVLALWNSGFAGGLQARLAMVILSVERALFGSDAASRMLPRATFEAWGKSIEGAKTPFDWLSHNEESVAAYVADPLCGFDASVSMWQDVVAMGARGADNTAFTALDRSLPIHLTAGGQDPCTKYGAEIKSLAERLSALGFLNVTTRIYPQMRHELLNETAEPGAEAVMSEFADWVDGFTQAD